MALPPDTTIKEIFLTACERNDLQKVQLLLGFGVDVNWKRHVGACSSLHIAVSKNSGELLELLLAQTGVDVNIRSNANVTPLMVACNRGHENIVSRLCQFTDIQLNISGDNGGTALHWAVAVNRRYQG